MHAGNAEKHRVSTVFDRVLRQWFADCNGPYELVLSLISTLIELGLLNRNYRSGKE
jgi:hypothetical protein